MSAFYSALKCVRRSKAPEYRTRLFIVSVIIILMGATQACSATTTRLLHEHAIKAQLQVSSLLSYYEQMETMVRTGRAAASICSPDNFSVRFDPVLQEIQQLRKEANAARKNHIAFLVQNIADDLVKLRQRIAEHWQEAAGAKGLTEVDSCLTAAEVIDSRTDIEGRFRELLLSTIP